MATPIPQSAGMLPTTVAGAFRIRRSCDKSNEPAKLAHVSPIVRIDTVIEYRGHSDTGQLEADEWPPRKIIVEHELVILKIHSVEPASARSGHPRRPIGRERGSKSTLRGDIHEVFRRRHARESGSFRPLAHARHARQRRRKNPIARAQIGSTTMEEGHAACPHPRIKHAQRSRVHALTVLRHGAGHLRWLPLPQEDSAPDCPSRVLRGCSRSGSASVAGVCADVVNRGRRSRKVLKDGQHPPGDCVHSLGGLSRSFAEVIE